MKQWLYLKKTGLASRNHGRTGFMFLYDWNRSCKKSSVTKATRLWIIFVVSFINFLIQPGKKAFNIDYVQNFHFYETGSSHIIQYYLNKWQIAADRLTNSQITFYNAAKKYWGENKTLDLVS